MKHAMKHVQDIPSYGEIGKAMLMQCLAGLVLLLIAGIAWWLHT